MLPLVGVPETTRHGMAPYRDVFCREAGFDHVSRYVTGLGLSPNKTLQGSYDVQVWDRERGPSRRARHEAVFEAGWAADELMPCRRKRVAADDRGRGRAVLSLDWTYAPHDRGPAIWGVQGAWDHVEKRPSRSQTVVPAVLANRALLAGVEVVVQVPYRQAEEVAYLNETVRESYDHMEAVRGRVLELLHHFLHQRRYKKRPEIAREIVPQLEQEGHVPPAHYAFDHGVLALELTRFIASVGNHWVSDLESSRHIQWQGHWQRVEEVAMALRRTHPQRFRPVTCGVAMGRRPRCGRLPRSCA